ncbi:MAG: hypothetical protein NVSMB47_08340 [Polyangiales bacterium]
MIRPRSVRLALGSLLVLAAAACGGGLKLRLMNSSARKPSNVAVYFTVDTSDDKPVPGLTADKFVIYEDGQKVSEFESKQTILNPKVAAAHDTLLLVDMSGSITESGKVDELTAAAKQFTTRIEKQQKVSIAAFDGSPELTTIVPFTESEGAASSGVDRLKTFKPRDPSTNLNGAVVKGLAELKRALDAEPKPLKFGTLVVFTDGTDRANRVTKQQLDDELKKPEYKDYDLYAIGVGAEMANSKLEDIGRTETVKENDQKNLGKAFDQMAAKIEGKTGRYYLLSYCTPSRAGEHEVTVEAHADGKSGTIKYKFMADGMGPNCDPNTAPDFDITHPKEPAMKVEKK